MVKNLVVMVVVCLVASACAVLGDSAITGLHEVVSDFRGTVHEVSQTGTFESQE